MRQSEGEQGTHEEHVRNRSTKTQLRLTPYRSRPKMRRKLYTKSHHVLQENDAKPKARQRQRQRQETGYIVRRMSTENQREPEELRESDREHIHQTQLSKPMARPASMRGRWAMAPGPNGGVQQWLYGCILKRRNECRDGGRTRRPTHRKEDETPTSICLKQLACHF